MRSVSVPARREHDDRHAGLGAQRAADVAAVAVGQREVEQHEVGRTRTSGVQRARRRGGDRGLEALALEQPRERLGDRCLVLDDENARRHLIRAYPRVAVRRTGFAKSWPRLARRLGGRPAACRACPSIAARSPPAARLPHSGPSPPSRSAPARASRPRSSPTPLRRPWSAPRPSGAPSASARARPSRRALRPPARRAGERRAAAPAGPALARAATLPVDDAGAPGAVAAGPAATTARDAGSWRVRRRRRPGPRRGRGSWRVRRRRRPRPRRGRGSGRERRPWPPRRRGRSR